MFASQITISFNSLESLWFIFKTNIEGILNFIHFTREQKILACYSNLQTNYLLHLLTEQGHFHINGPSDLTKLK